MRKLLIAIPVIAAIALMGCYNPESHGSPSDKKEVGPTPPGGDGNPTSTDTPNNASK